VRIVYDFYVLLVMDEKWVMIVYVILYQCIFPYSASRLL
jgi:hypothetical protein